MHKLLAPWIRRLQRDVEIPPPSNAIKVAEQVRRLLSQALRLSDRQDLFAGFAPARPAAKPREVSQLPLDAVRPEPSDHEPDMAAAKAGRFFCSRPWAREARTSRRNLKWRE
jgi:hypothetical protein